jgi:hypothetical protein
LSAQPGMNEIPGRQSESTDQDMSVIHRTVRRARKKARELANAVFIDRSGPAQTTVLYSSGRSGSTWLSEILGSVPRTRLIFEPFHPHRGLAELADYRYRYIEPGRDVPVLEAVYDAILNGKRATPWTEHLNSPTTMIYKRRLVKLVRANLLFPWLVNRYPDQKHVLLLRHPAAVVLSQVRNGWNLSSARIRDQADLRQSPAISALGRFGWPTSGFLSNLVFWAAENRVAIDRALESDTMIVFYEHICLSPAEVLDELSRFLGLTLPTGALRRLDKVSWSSSADIGSMTVTEKISRWKGDLSEEQSSQVAEVLETCGLHEFYSLEPKPVAAGAEIVREHNLLISSR